MIDPELVFAAAAHMGRALLGKINELLALASIFALACWAMWKGTELAAYIALGNAVFAYLWCRLIRVGVPTDGRSNRRQGIYGTQRDDGVPTEAAD